MAKRKAPEEDKVLKDLGKFQITRDTPRLSELEERVLAAYDELEEIRLERALLETSSKISIETGLSDDQLKKAITRAEREVLESRANYQLRNRIVGNILMVDPILKAVHVDKEAGRTRSQTELKRLLDQRDVLGLTQANMASNAQEMRTQLAQSQVDTIRAVERNRQLAQQVCELAAQLRKDGPESVEDEGLQERLTESTMGMEQAKRSRLLLKNVVSAMVAASGVDWSQDDVLRALVLDEDT